MPNSDMIFLSKEAGKPESVIINKGIEWEVKNIINDKIFHGKLKYLVKWKGYNGTENIWELAHYHIHALAKV